MTRLRNRREAGRALGALLETYRTLQPVVLGVPRGGVPVAFEIARALEAPLDVFVVRRLGVPGEDGLTLGAIASGGVVVRNDDVIADAGMTPESIGAAVTTEMRELQRREVAYRSGRPRLSLREQIVILVDDGMATGASMLLTVRALRAHRPAQIVVAVPVASRQALALMRNAVDDWACVIAPEPFFGGAGLWYEDFRQVTDAEVHDLLAQALPGQRLVATSA
jgi:predicted phosphoribosyltransferase